MWNKCSLDSVRQSYAHLMPAAFVTHMKFFPFSALLCALGANVSLVPFNECYT